MERPHADTQPKQRQLNGEIVYLDEMRRSEKMPIPFAKLGGAAIQLYEDQADAYELSGARPDILGEYERYDNKPSEVVASCVAMANELLALKDSDSHFTFVDIVVEASPASVLAKLQNSPAGRVLAAEDEQLAIPSNGEYYPVLDMRKQNARLVGVGLRVWGWDDEKVVFTNEEGENYNYKRHLLVYPADEQSSRRRFQVSFGYDDGTPGGFSESVSLSISTDGSVGINSRVWAAEYAETGYEGHGGSSFYDPTDDDIAAFGDLIAEIVGDSPESWSMKIDRELRELAEAVSPAARQAVQNLIEATWPAQAEALLTIKIGDDQAIAEQLRDETTVDAGIVAIDMLVKEWSARMGR